MKATSIATALLAFICAPINAEDTSSCVATVTTLSDQYYGLVGYNGINCTATTSVAGLDVTVVGGATVVSADDTRLTLNINGYDLTPPGGAKNSLCAMVPGLSFLSIFTVQACLASAKTQLDPPALSQSWYQVSAVTTELDLTLAGCMGSTCTKQIGLASIGSFTAYASPLLRFWRVFSIAGALVILLPILLRYCCCRTKVIHVVAHNNNEAYYRV